MRSRAYLSIIIIQYPDDVSDMVGPFNMVSDRLGRHGDRDFTFVKQRAIHVIKYGRRKEFPSIDDGRVLQRRPFRRFLTPIQIHNSFICLSLHLYVQTLGKLQRLDLRHDYFSFGLGLGLRKLSKSSLLYRWVYIEVFII